VDSIRSVLLTQYCAGGKIKKNEMGWACGAYGGGERCAQVVGREGRRPLGRPTPRWEDNIKRDLPDVGGGYGDWMEQAQDRDRWRYGNELSGYINAGNFLTSCKTS
jgi:hypothetical protein